MAEFNLHDYAQTFMPNGQEYPIARVLDQSDPVVRDALLIESNSDSGHEYAVQNGLPKAMWRQAYQGVTPTKGSQTVVKEAYGRMSAVSIVDVALAEKGGNVKEIRANMKRDKLEVMAQEFAHKFFYGSAQDNEKAFVGFAKRYSEKSAKSGSQIVDAGGTQANKQTSIYLVGWGRNKIYTFFPKGMKAGIHTYDYSANGPIDLQDANGDDFPGYKEQLEWCVGLAVQDWRYGARVCNIENPASMNKAAKIALYENFITAVGKIRNLETCHLVAYCSRDTKDALRAGFMAAGGQSSPIVYQRDNLNKTGNDRYGLFRDLVIDGIQIKADDAIVHTEAVVA